MLKYGIAFVAGVVCGFVALKVIEAYRNREDGPTEEDLAESEEEEQKEEKEESFCEVEEEPEKDDGDSADDPSYTDYTVEYSGSDDICDSAEKESPSEEDKPAKSSVKRRPRLIKEEEVGSLSGYYTETLKYYSYDDALVTDANEELFDQDYYVGDALTKYGFKDDDSQRDIYVRNYALGIDYEIIKVLASFAEYQKR